MAFFDDVGNFFGGIGKGLAGALGVGSGDPGNNARGQLNQIGGTAQGFAGADQGFSGQQQQQLANAQNALGSQRDYLTKLMQGQNSVSAEQLRQGLQQNLASQQAMAASANPGNSAMAARNAAMNMGQMGYGMAGQQALAGLQERNQAAQNLAQLNLGAGQLASGAALGGMGAANNALGVANQSYTGQLGPNQQKTWGNLLMGGVGGGGGFLGSVLSDERAKENIRNADDDARKVTRGLLPKAYVYKDKRNGTGKRLGITAQDLERAGLKQAVVDTPAGKVVKGGEAATIGLALIGSLGKRVSKLEGK